MSHTTRCVGSSVFQKTNFNVSAFYSFNLITIKCFKGQIARSKLKQTNHFEGLCQEPQDQMNCYMGLLLREGELRNCCSR